MDNFSFLQKYIELQTSVTIDEVIDLGFVRIDYNKIEPSPYENFALTNKILSEGELNQIEQIFQRLGRKQAFYFENKPELKLLVDFLTTKGYKLDREDAWMFHNGENINADNFNLVRKVESEDDLAAFLKTFDNSFQKDDPQNPFGELGNYLKVTEAAWHRHRGTNRLQYFIAYKGDKPVAASALNNLNGIGYICNVGSLREVRGEGFGKLATLYALSSSVKNGNDYHCLATAEGTRPNEFYKRQGFVIKFTAVCYCKLK